MPEVLVPIDILIGTHVVVAAWAWMLTYALGSRRRAKEILAGQERLRALLAEANGGSDDAA